MIKIDIISGFLGAGKTTLIKRLLSTKLKDEKVVLIENEYGEIGIDAGFLSQTNINIKEINEGCICCSLQGDFTKSLNEVASKYHPTRIIIEPSGVGKLSDIVKACVDANVPDSKINALVCLCDCQKAKMYLRNFGEFYIDQISHAKAIILSRTDVASADKVNQALEIIRQNNTHAVVVTTPVKELSDDELLKAYEAVDDHFEEELLEEVKHIEHHHHHHHDHDEHDEKCHCHDHDEECHCHEEDDEHHDHDEECHCHDHEHHDGKCSCGCDHDADEVFTSYGFETAKKYDRKKLEESLELLSESSRFGTILRAKGIIDTTEGFVEFDLVPGEYEIRKGKAIACGKLCVIGSNLSKEEIKNLF